MLQDGNDLFRAVSMHMYGTEICWPFLRLFCAKYGVQRLEKVSQKVTNYQEITIIMLFLMESGCNRVIVSARNISKYGTPQERFFVYIFIVPAVESLNCIFIKMHLLFPKIRFPTHDRLVVKFHSLFQLKEVSGGYPDNVGSDAELKTFCKNAALLSLRCDSEICEFSCLIYLLHSPLTYCNA